LLAIVCFFVVGCKPATIEVLGQKIKLSEELPCREIPMSNNPKPTNTQQGTYNSGSTQQLNQYKSGIKTQSGTVGTKSGK
jgi:hypothetical protein